MVLSNQLTTIDARGARLPERRSPSGKSTGQPCVVLPLLENALPLAHLKMVGRLQSVQRQRVMVVCSPARVISPGSALAVGVSGADRGTKFTAMIVDEVRRVDNQQATVVGHVGGRLLNILQADMLRPSLNPVSRKFEHSVSDRILDRLADAGILERTIVDRIQVCPHCQAIPLIRSACHTCGSPFISTDELIHHFACAHVASVDEFRHGDLLRCPKCHLVPLIVGSDFEYLPGLHTCLDCSKISSRLQLRAKCTFCHSEFAIDESLPLDLVGFRPNRLQ
jgi:hypothetical protein